MLDDMWSVEAWDEIKFFLPDTGNGSRVVVTTRHSYVANHFGAPRLEMRCLGKDDSWDLFCQKAFEAEQGCPQELEEIGKKIVEKCKGLPLAIVVVGGHLRKSSTTLEHWENAASHMDSMLNSTENDGEEQCMNVLSLSYSCLPALLKPCFLLLGAFPEDQRIHVVDVFNLWIAEGFIEASENDSSEVVAEGYVRDLSQRNLILVDAVSFYGDIVYLKLHDLVRDLCLKIAKREEFLYVFDTPRAIDRERRVVMNGTILEANHQAKTSGAPIRCLIFECGWLSYEFELLRTLNKAVVSSMGTSVFQQVNLRFLKVDLIYKSVRAIYLPSSMSLLWNLQMLTINVPHQSIVVAPYVIWEMLQLRHLEIDPICLLDPLPVENEADDVVLRNLHTLRDVKNFRVSEEVCKRVPNIRELYLSYSDGATLYYCPHNLGCFSKLETLVLQFDLKTKWRDFALNLTFPASLNLLTLSGCRVDWEEMTMMVGSLPNLTGLYLYPSSVVGPVWTPAEGKFLSLKCLSIWGCDDLVHWDADSYHFPVLRNLRLRYLSKLGELPWGIGEIPTLKLIKLEYCSESASISAMEKLVEQEELGNESLRVHVSFRGDEEVLESFNDKVPEQVLGSKNLTLRLQNVKPKCF